MCAGWGDWDETLSKVEPSEEAAGGSATELEVAESRLRAVLSSNKVIASLRCLPRTRVRGRMRGSLADGWRES